MTKPKHFQLLVIIMAATTLTVTAVSITSLYNAAFNQHRFRLIEVAKSQALLIEAIAQVGSTYSIKDTPINWQSLTLQQVSNVQRQLKGFGKSGEYTLARKQGSSINFLVTNRHSKLKTPWPVPFASNLAEPMRLALLGQSGTMIGLDYKGTQVLAAYEPINILALGLVAKIDISEIRSPFINAGLVTLIVAILAILVASLVFFRTTRPIVQIIEQQAETFKTLLETVLEAIILIDVDGKIQFSNPSSETLFGYSPGELIGSHVKCLMPSPHKEAHDSYVEQYLVTGVKKIIGSGRQLIGVRKNGSQFPMHLSVGDINLSHTRLFAGVIMDLTKQQKLQRQIMAIPITEQRRIGQDLHDGLGQQLTGLSLLAATLLVKTSKPEQELVKQLKDGLKNAIIQIRAISRGLVPIEIGVEEFDTAIKNLCDEVEQQCDIRVQLQIDQNLQLPDDVTAMHLYRVVQEALNNAIKHAGASLISVSLKSEHDLGLLEVYDNGCGIPTGLEQSNGIGMQIMRYRSQLINGEFSIDSAVDKGTRISCQFPMKSILDTA